MQVAGCLSPVDRFRLGSVVDRVGFRVRDSLSGELVLAANPGAPLALGPSTVRRTTGLGCHSEVRRKTPGPWNPSPASPNRRPHRVRGFHRPGSWQPNSTLAPAPRRARLAASNRRTIPFQLPARGDSRDAHRQIGRRDNGEAGRNTNGVRAEKPVKTRPSPHPTRGAARLRVPSCRSMTGDRIA